MGLLGYLSGLEFPGIRFTPPLRLEAQAGSLLIRPAGGRRIPTMNRFPSCAAAAGALALALSACGSSASTTSHSASASASVATTGSAAASAAAPAKSARVLIQNYAFHPTSITVTPGAKVTFTNHDQTNHTATSNGSGFDTGTLAPGASKTLTLKKAGTYSYFCQFHAFMKATVIVK
jgi:plastocyanin